MPKMQVWLAVAVSVLYILLSCIDATVQAVQEVCTEGQEGVDQYAHWRDHAGMPRM